MGICQPLGFLSIFSTFQVIIANTALASPCLSIGRSMHVPQKNTSLPKQNSAKSREMPSCALNQNSLPPGLGFVSSYTATYAALPFATAGKVTSSTVSTFDTYFWAQNCICYNSCYCHICILPILPPAEGSIPVLVFYSLSFTLTNNPERLVTGQGYLVSGLTEWELEPGLALALEKAA